MLVAFFNDFGCNDFYGAGFPSRHTYVKDRLRSLDKDSQWSAVEAAVEHINKYLAFDGLLLVPLPDSSKFVPAIS